MAIDSISNAASLNDYKAEQKVQPVTAVVQTAKITGTDTAAAKAYTGKQDGMKEEENKDAQAGTNSLKSIINDTNNKIKPTRTRCEFSYHKEINRVSIKVMDADTDDIIREIPPEETMEMLQKLWEVAGLLVDEKR